jgi:DNA-binding LytR/AlgR family response regulator
MRYNIAICDDCREYGEIVSKIIEEVASNNKINCSIETYTSGKNLVEAFKESEFDILFLDMEMPELNGVETGLLIRKMSKNNPVIFYLTSHKEYAYDSYQVKAKDYFLKPIKRFQIEEALNECMKEINVPQEFLDVKDVNHIKHHIPINEITHILRKKEDRKIHIYFFDKKEIIIVQTLENIERELINNDNIVRASKSCLVNMDNVKMINKNLIYFRNGFKEEASRRCLSQLNNKFKLKNWR